jgi:hypothetical protein
MKTGHLIEKKIGKAGEGTGEVIGQLAPRL